MTPDISAQRPKQVTRARRTGEAGAVALAALVLCSQGMVAHLPSARADPIWLQSGGSMSVPSPQALTDGQAAVDFMLPSLPVDGGGVYLGVQLRQQDDYDSYRARVRVLPGGDLRASITRVSNGVELSLGQIALPDHLSSGQVLHVKARVSGADTVAVSVKAWPDGVAEPDWQQVTTDTTADRLSTGSTTTSWAYLSSTTPDLSLDAGDEVVRPDAPAAPAPVIGPPGPGNTGVPAGTTLTPYYGNLVITTPGARYDRLDIHGFVTVKAPDVTISRSIIRGGVASGNIGIVTDYGYSNLNIEDSELVPSNPSVWIDALKGNNFTARRVNAHGTVDGVKIHGDNVRVEASWVHDMVDYAQDPNQSYGPTHNDGVQILGGNNIQVVGNRLSGASNSAIQVTQDYAAVTNSGINHNWLDGGNCTVQVNNKPLPSLVAPDISYNRFGHNTRYSNCAIIASNAVAIYPVGNVWDDTDTPISAVHRY